MPEDAPTTPCLDVLDAELEALRAENATSRTQVGQLLRRVQELEARVANRLITKTGRAACALRKQTTFD
jgi:hypothetical protein